jgi:hypothetical protein
MSLLVISRDVWWMNHKFLELRYGTHNRSEMVAVLGTPCAIPPISSNSTQRPLYHPKRTRMFLNKYYCDVATVTCVRSVNEACSEYNAVRYY